MRQLKPKIAHFIRFNLAKFKFRYLVRYRYYILPFILILLTVALTTATIASPSVQSYLLSTNENVLSRSTLVICLSVLLTTGTSLYFWIDYRQHNAPLKQADPTVHYSFKHHLKVVTFPLLRFKWKPLAYAMATSTLTLLALVTTLYVGMRNVQAATSVSVTINQKSGTTDPNPSYTSVFTVVFSEAIDKTTFTSADMTLAGTAPGQTVQSITEAGSFDKTTYEVRIQATGAGTITPSIAQDLITAQNVPTDTNQNSTSTDNSVTYNGDYAPSEFVTTWKTDNVGSPGNQIIIPTTGIGYNYNVDWGDGNTSSGLTSSSSHTYSIAGSYVVKISGSFPRFSCNYCSDRLKLMTIEQWGTNPWASMDYAFRAALNLTVPAKDAPNFSNVTNLTSMFEADSSLNSNFNHWDVSNVTLMIGTFQSATAFNQPLNNWDVSSVTNMAGLLNGATAFNQPLNNWDVSSVTNMGWLLAGTAFNHPLENWDTSSV